MRTPLAPDIEFTQIDPKYVKVTIIRNLLGWVPALAVAVGVALIINSNYSAATWIWVFPAVVAALFGWSLWVTVRRARVIGYAELDEELLVRSGIMFQKLSVVPYGRMQQVEINSGPLLANSGLATVELVTASADTNAKIPGVTRAEAERLRTKLTALGNSNMEGL
ncbi:MAG: PH domain-containing protein [Trueperella sp.]|nr:PH domain-containing protein [Trueperella sp.]